MSRSWFCPGEAARQPQVVGLMDQVGVLQDAQRFKEAADLVKAAIAADPHNPLLHAILAEILIVADERPTAVPLIRTNITEYPDSAILHELLAAALDPSTARERGEIQQEQKVAMELKPCMPLAHANMGFTLNGKHDFAAAAAAFRTAISLSPEYAIAHQGLGVALLNVGHRDEGLEQLRAAVALLPDSWRTHAALADALISCRRVDEGVAEYRTAVALSPRNVELHMELTKALLAAGKANQAIWHWKSLVGAAIPGGRCKTIAPRQSNGMGASPSATLPLVDYVLCMIA